MAGSPTDLKTPLIPIHPLDALAVLDPAACLEIGPKGAVGRLTAGAGDGEVAGGPVLLATHGAGPGPPDDRTALLEAVAALWRLGFGGDWDPLHDLGRRRVPLPTYPFATTRYVIDSH